LVNVKCYNCGSSASRPYDSENGYDLRKCQQCGLLYVNPRPADEVITESAKTGKHEGDNVLDVTGAYSDGKEARQRRILADLFQGEKAAGDWLDIGCGFGEFLGALQSVFGDGLRARGLEPNVAKIETAGRRGLNVSDFDLRTHNEKYDIVSVLNVYSHLPDPVETLGQWARLLRPGGQFVIETGDSCELPPWRHTKPYSLPDHLSFASEEIVSGILRRLGFEIAAVVKEPSYPDLKAGYAVRQMIKLLVPGKRANLGWLGNPRRDCWIRARFR
jgi:SAM-dependent methyltransferase